MSKVERVARFKWFFYARNDFPDKYGEIDNEATPIISGLFAQEKATKPVEIVDDNVSVSEIQYILFGAYIRRYWDVIESGMFAWCPETDKTMELIGDPLDSLGTRMETRIYVVDNIRRPIDTSQLGTEYGQ